MKVRTPSTGSVAGGGLDAIGRESVVFGNVFTKVFQFLFLAKNFAVQRLLFSGVRRRAKVYHMGMEYKSQVTCL